MALSYSMRRRIAEFDPLTAGTTISQFCKEQQISRQTFYNIRDRVTALGDAGIIPDSTAPITPHRLHNDQVRDQVAAARIHLKTDGRDHGPWSIHYYLRDEQGVEHPPSRATIARMLDDFGLTDPNARKRPRSSLRRYARGKANEMWQLDGLTYHLFDSQATTVTIYQLIDDATRFDVGTRAFTGDENSADACTVLAAAFETRGIPGELLSDNGSAFASYRHGALSQTEIFVAGYGVRSITGRPAHPGTQGKDERSHKTIKMYLDARHPTTLDEVTTAIESYRTMYNTIRRHQGLLLGGVHLTPQHAWEVFIHADPPTRPIPLQELEDRAANYLHRRRGLTTTTEDASQVPIHEDVDDRATHAPADPADDVESIVVASQGCILLNGIRVYIGTPWKRRRLLIHRADNIISYFTANDGEELCRMPDPLPPDTPAWVSILDIDGAWHRKPPRRYNKKKQTGPS